MRIIMLIDMDYFFAQVEERENPELKGKPVVVGADPKEGRGRGVVCTSNYEARKFGIKSAMPISTAWHKCPTAIFLPVRGELYYEASRNVMRIFRQFTDKFEQVSVDEAYFDVSNRCNSFEEARELAKQIKKEVLEKEYLTCSVGIGPNKLIAKIAAGENKPDGLTVVLPDDVASFLNPKKVGTLYGVGPKTESNLNSLGIITVDDLVKMPKEIILQEMGSFGEDIWHMARGLDNREVNEDWITKSIGRQYTFERDTKNKRFIMAMIDDMIREIYRELKEQNFFFKNITLKVRYEDFDTHTKSKTIDEYTDNVKILRMIAEEQLNPFLKDQRRIRLVGVSVHSLSNKNIKSQRKDMNLLSI